jgi:beta-lactamase regulating signal transducer with metallopeptidase domain
MTAAVLQFGAVKLAVSLLLASVAWIATRRRARPQLVHALWLSVLAAMLVPVVIPLPIAWPSAGFLAPSDVVLGGGAGAQGALGDLGLFLDADGSIAWPFVAIAAWLMGSAVVLAVSLARVVMFSRALSRGSSPASPGLRRIGELASHDLGLRAPALTLVHAQVPPLVWWTGRSLEPLLVMPSALVERLSDAELRWVMTHEAAHIRRRDHLVRWLEWLVVVAFWWNPVVWMARRQLHAAEELHCDELVLRHARPEPRSYARALVKVLEFLSQSPARPTPVLAMGAVPARRTHTLERRLTMIVQHTPRSPLSRRVRVTLGCGASLMALLGVLNVGITDASSSVPTVPTAVDECDELTAAVKRAIEAGQVTADVGKKRIAECLDRAKREKFAAELRRAVAAGTITEAQAAEKLRALETVEGKTAELSKAQAMSALEERLKRQVAEGVITADQAKATLDAASAERGVAKPGPTRGDCEKMKVEVAAAIKSGAASAQEAEARFRKACG